MEDIRFIIMLIIGVAGDRRDRYEEESASCMVLLEREVNHQKKHRLYCALSVLKPGRSNRASYMVSLSSDSSNL
jgi:hypothetical protein